LFVKNIRPRKISLERIKGIIIIRTKHGLCEEKYKLSPCVVQCYVIPMIHHPSPLADVLYETAVALNGIQSMT